MFLHVNIRAASDVGRKWPPSHEFDTPDVNELNTKKVLTQSGHIHIDAEWEGLFFLTYCNTKSHMKVPTFI